MHIDKISACRIGRRTFPNILKIANRSFPQIIFTPFPKILIDVKYRYDRYNTGKSKVNLHVQDRIH